MDTQLLILIGLLSFCMLLLSTARMQEGFEDAEDEYDDAEDDDDVDEDEQEPGADPRPLTTEPDARKPSKQKSSLPPAPVVAEGAAPKAKPIPIVKQVAKAVIKTSVTGVKKAFKVEKAHPKKQVTANFLDKDATLFTPHSMLCLPSTSGFQCIYQ